MTEAQSERFIDLTIALQYDSYAEKYLSDFDRMLIQKARSALMKDERYKLSADLEGKIQDKLNYIHKKDWEAPIY